MIDMVNKKLINYIEKEIFPLYLSLYAHGLTHINYVIEHSFIIAKDYDVDLNMVYVVACYHDLGLLNIDMNRDDHAKESGKILANDKELLNFFTKEEIRIMKEAVEDHQGSRNIVPRNIYGMIVSDADRDVDVKVLAKRQLYTSIKYFKELKTFDEHFERCYKYILERNKKKFNLWTKNNKIIKMMNKFQNDFLDKDYTRQIYLEEWNYIHKNHLEEKFINYYKD